MQLLSTLNRRALTSIGARSRTYTSAPRILSSHTLTLDQRSRPSQQRPEPNPARTLTTTAQPPPTTTGPPPRQPTDLSQSAPPTRTVAALNPRTDPETGAPWHVDVTARAARRLQRLMAEEGNGALCLRVAVESGGCHGFQYGMTLVDCADVEPAEDTLFVVEEGAVAPGDAERADWRAFAQGRAKVVMDGASLELLQGSKVDYTVELIGSQFKIVDNPRATSSCGCGTSFDVKI